MSFLDGIGSGSRADLVAYARLEYGGGDGLWLLAAIDARGREREPRTRRGRWLRATTGRAGREPGESRARDAPGSVRASRSGETPPTREACAHEDIAFLGVGARARYYRCGACGAPFVVQDSQAWTIRPTNQEVGLGEEGAGRAPLRSAYA